MSYLTYMSYAPYLFIAGFVLAVVIVVCWIILPFAVIGTKPLLRQILAEERKTNELLENRATVLRRDSSVSAPTIMPGP